MNLEGYSWDHVLPLLQVTSVIGIYGLTLLTLLAACLPACLADDNKRNRMVVAGSLVALLVVGLWGSARLIFGTTAMVPDVRLRIVQPDVDQALKWQPDQREKGFQELLDLSTAPGGLKPPTHIIWPETASTFYLAEDAERRRMIAEKLSPGVSVITGVIRRSMDDDAQSHYYNSLVAVDSRARIIAGYDKVHLVPFGEYMPLRTYLPIRTLVGMGVDFMAGEGAITLQVPGLPSFSPLICYEAIFSGVVTPRDDRPHMLINVTNDGWYGHTAGPYQHFSIARVRAIEEGLPLARAANTGISGVVDAYGRVVSRLGLSEKGFVDSPLPEAIKPTFFSRFGENAVWVLFDMVTLATGFGLWRRRKS
jgi:apolipoprotein N-acyltransferase